MIVSFTGSKHGMTSAQELEVRLILDKLLPSEVHHGLCKGADAEFHDIVLKQCDYLYGPRPRIHLHPGVNAYGKSPTRADVKLPEGWEFLWHPEKPYIKRDEDMAKVCHALIGTPSTSHEVLRSGTWTTLRRGRKFHKELYIVLPDGETINEF